MKVSNKFLLSLVTVLSAVDIILVLVGVRDVSVYFIWDAIIYLIITLAFSNLSSRYKAVLNKTSAIVFVGFLYIVALKILQIMK